eukprot:g13432.t1
MAVASDEKYVPGKGLDRSANARLRARQAEEKQRAKDTDFLLGNGAQKVARCGKCTRPLDAAAVDAKVFVCSRCEPGKGGREVVDGGRARGVEGSSWSGWSDSKGSNLAEWTGQLMLAEKPWHCFGRPDGEGWRHLSCIALQLGCWLWRTQTGAFERFQEANDRRGQAVALDMLALGYLHSGDFGEAAKLAQQQASLLQEHGDRPGQARALRLRCRLSVQLQDFNGAIAAASEAAAISGDLRSYPEKAAALQLMADCQMRNHSLSEAREAALQARQLYRDLLDRDQEVLALLQASQCSALSGDTDLAMQTASEAKDRRWRRPAPSPSGSDVA